ncbi:hypothetical protein [Fibrobacter sp.]|uniref:hypothetical protein n=1 Tax=Fibrobacter sp. TaxID=35828 RepID=UPI0025BD37C2|nr:hypothetical protein [Fibrobacter sp.]MBR4008171.1 hypothetical protein [Fibrobacter sp.]
MTDYIRIKNTLPNSPKVIQLARELHCGRFAALGLMVHWLAWLDMHTEDGKTELSSDEVNAYVFYDQNCDGLSALVSIGWAELVDGKVRAVDFDKYCTPTAKSRISACERQRKHRNKKRS